MTLPIALVLSEWLENCPDQVFNDRKKSWAEFQPISIPPEFKKKQRDQKFNGYRNYTQNYAAQEKFKKLYKKEKYKNPKGNNRYAEETNIQKQPPASNNRNQQHFNKMKLDPKQYKPNIPYPKPCRQFSDDFTVPPPNFVRPADELLEEMISKNLDGPSPNDQKPYLEERSSKTGFLNEENMSSELLEEIGKTNEKLKILTNGYSLDTICPFKYFGQEQFAEELVIHKTLHASRVAYLSEKQEEEKGRIETQTFLNVNQIPLTSDLLEKALKSKLSVNAVPFTFKPQTPRINYDVKMDAVAFLEFVSRIDDDTLMDAIQNLE